MFVLECHGTVRERRHVTAQTQPGSPCRHSDSMQDNSVRNQYCDSNGVFHQTVYVHDKHCHVSWAQKAFSPQKLSYRTDTCTYGYKLESCMPGPCPDAPDNVALADEVMIAEWS